MTNADISTTDIPPGTETGPKSSLGTGLGAGTTTGAGGGLLTARLDREWQRLRRDPRALRTTRSWGRREEATPPIGRPGPLAAVLETLADLDQLLAATHRDAGRRGDEILLELVVLAGTEELAGRIVLQRILPALLARSRRYGDRHPGQTTADMVVAAAWLTVRTYDHRRRRRHVAASIVSDAVYVAFRQPFRRRAATEQPRSTEAWAQRAADDSPTAIEELAAVIAEARRCGVGRQDLDLLCDLVRTGSSSIVAAELGVTPRTVRNHRDRALARVRAAVLTDAA